MFELCQLCQNKGGIFWATIPITFNKNDDVFATTTWWIGYDRKLESTEITIDVYEYLPDSGIAVIW